MHRGLIDEVGWKTDHVPLLYDWISSRKLIWPHGAVQWGARVSDIDSRARSAVTYSTRALYLAERTGSSTRDPNTLLHFDVRVVDEHVNKPSDVAKPWLDDAVVNGRADQMSTQDFWLKKRIIHPGEVNKIRLVAPDVVVTHTDSPKLYVWNFAKQPNRKKDDLKEDYSKPNCTLVGHSKNAEYAMSVSPPPDENSEDVLIASGGIDKRVLVWRLSDYQSLGKELMQNTTFGVTHDSKEVGHSDTVEGVSFNRVDRNIIASVGRDSRLILWDMRDAQRPTAVVEKAHIGDINCVDYGGADEFLIVTGGSDEKVKVWDRRLLVKPDGTPIPKHDLYGHKGQVYNTVWNRYVRNVIASSADDGEVFIWNCSNEQPLMPVPENVSQALLFRHVGHSVIESGVIDMEWQPDESDPWCIATLSETVGDAGGSTLQIWRISDLIYRPKEIVCSDLGQSVTTS